VNIIKLPKDFDTIGPPPYPFQMETIIYGIKHPSCGLLLEMGLGKTRCAIDIARYRIQTENIEKVLVVTPTSIMYNWGQEIKKFSEYKSVVLHSHIRSERIARIEALNHSKQYHFGIINYEALHSYYSKITDMNIGLLIFDESARYIKNHLTKRTKAAIAISEKVGRAIILTGTPIANRPLDIWSQFRVMDRGKTFGTNFYRFRTIFFNTIQRHRFKEFVLKEDSAKYINSGIYDTCIRFKKGDVLPDLPKKLYYKIEIPLSGKTKAIYNRVKKEVITDIETTRGKSTLVITNILTKLLRLQTITSGFIKGEDGKTNKLLETPKLNALIDEIESIVDAEEYAVVWVRFLYTIKLIKNELKKRKIKSITMSGEDKDKYDKWKTFQKDKSIPIFIGQIQSGGIGIELFKLDSNANTQHMIFYENVWSLDVREQAIDRIHRIGQESMCRYVDIVMKNTIDERILGSISANRRIATSILENGVKEWLK